jgi:hypothetical protein
VEITASFKLSVVTLKLYSIHSSLKNDKYQNELWVESFVDTIVILSTHINAVTGFSSHTSQVSLLNVLIISQYHDSTITCNLGSV